ncbi:MAG TPA: DNA polymerase III subunit epsilon [Gammaproteobacteria bacterium]|nr:DNA polymerase III subunit epsilon [Gammaproteobacteria bacterium]
MRQVVLDTETTGLEVEQGHRIIEIGCIELVNRRRTGRDFHRYLCPDRAIDRGAGEVHGIDLPFLADKPRFADIAADLLAYLEGAELIIHNAAFDVGFLDAELAGCSGLYRCITEYCAVMDTLEFARRLHPGQRNTLDALCKRYAIDCSQRDLHGALLDAGLLADVYLAMTGGQSTLAFDSRDLKDDASRAAGMRPVVRDGIALRVVVATGAELAAHDRLLDAIEAASGGACVWRAAGPGFGRHPEPAPASEREN